jgi:hypothetical protein
LCVKDTKASVHGALATSSPRFDRRERLKLCELVKRCGKYPENASRCLHLISQLNVNINEVMCSNGFTIFHFACISGSYELLAALLPSADLSITTFHGDSPLYLAACAASWFETCLGWASSCGILVLVFLTNVFGRTRFKINSTIYMYYTLYLYITLKQFVFKKY